MIQNVLQHIGGIQNYGIISLFLFFSLFGVLFVWAMSLRKPHLEKMARMPLEEETDELTQ